MRHCDTISRSRTGIVLLMVLGVLAIMSVLAMSFLQMSKLERRISQNYTDSTRATIIAESGVEAAMAHIRSWRGGSVLDFNDSIAFNPTNPGLNLLESSQPSLASTVLPPSGFSGGKAVSGYVGSGSYVVNGDFYKLKITDTSGRLNLNDPNAVMDDGTFHLESLVSHLARILFGNFIAADLSAELIPRRDADFGGHFSSMDEVKFILTEPRSGGLPAVLSDDDYKRFERNVTVNAWQDPNVLRPHPAFSSDKGVATALGFSTPGGVSGFAQDPSVFDYPDPQTEANRLQDPRTFHNTYGDDIYTWNQFQHRGLELEPRSPVNLNTASRELIQAVLEGVQGLYVYEYGHESFIGLAENATERASASTPGGWFMWNRNTNGYNLLMQFPCSFGRASDFPVNASDWYRHTVTTFSRFQSQHDYRLLTEDRNSTLSGSTLGYGSVRRTVAMSEVDAEDLSKELHDRIHLARKPFRTWQEFRDFVYRFFNFYGNYWDFYPAIYGNGDGDRARRGLERKYMADAIVANCCPNADLNDFNPNATLFRHVDKNDLLIYTTEFCFESTGLFEIESEGYLLGVDGDIRSRTHIACTVEGFHTARITSQAQFFPSRPADMIEEQSIYFGINETPFQTAGADSPVMSSLAPMGTLTQSYPEALTDAEPGRIADAVYDGYVALSTYQLQDIVPTVSFRASFNGTLNADEARGATNLVPDPIEQPTTDRLMFSVSNDPTRPVLLTPGNLYADGGYSEPFRTLIYPSKNNFGSVQAASNAKPYGSMVFWYKPNWHPERSTRVRQLFSITNISKSIWFWTATDVNHPNIGDPLYTRKNSDFSLMFFPRTPPSPPANAGGFESFNQGPLEGLATGEQGYFNSFWTHKYQIRNTPNRFFMLNVSGGVHPEKQNTGFTNGILGGMIRAATDTVNYLDFPKQRSSSINVDKFRAHRWTFFAMSWRFGNKADISLQVNEGPLPDDTAYVHRESFTGNPYQPTLNTHANFWTNAIPPNTGALLKQWHVWSSPLMEPIGADNPMRFGEYRRSNPNFSADGSFDEIVCHRNYLVNLDANVFRDQYYNLGRYYHPGINGSATYQTGPIDKCRLFSLSGDSTDWNSDSVIIRSVAWTCWWPDTWLLPDSRVGNTDPLAGVLQNRNLDRLASRDMNPNDSTHSIFPDYSNPLWDDPLGVNMDPTDTDNALRPDWDPVTVDVAINNTWIFKDMASADYPNASQGETGLSNAQGSFVLQPDGTPVRLQTSKDTVDFKFFFNVEGTAPMHESPLLDDITITYYLSKPRILSWRVLLS